MTELALFLASGAVTLIGVPGMLLFAGGTWRRLGPDAAALLALWVAVGAVSGALGALPGGFAVLVPALGLVVSSGLVCALAERGLPRGIRLALVAGFDLLIFVPLALLVFGFGGTWLYREVGALDFAGALPAAVGAGVCAAAIGLSARRLGRVSGAPAGGPERVLAVRGALLVAVSAAGCAVGLELRVDELTPTIALHALAIPAVALLAAVATERIRHGRNTRAGAASGTLAGTAAALSSSAYLESVPALILGLLVGAVAGALPRRGFSAARRLAEALLLGGVTGMLFLGIFGLHSGFVYSGQPIFLGRQAMIVAAALGYSALVSALLTLPLRGLRSRRG